MLQGSHNERTQDDWPIPCISPLSLLYCRFGRFTDVRLENPALSLIWTSEPQGQLVDVVTICRLGSEQEKLDKVQKISYILSSGSRRAFIRRLSDESVATIVGPDKFAVYMPFMFFPRYAAS